MKKGTKVYVTFQQGPGVLRQVTKPGEIVKVHEDETVDVKVQTTKGSGASQKAVSVVMECVGHSPERKRPPFFRTVDEHEALAAEAKPAPTPPAATGDADDDLAEVLKDLSGLVIDELKKIGEDQLAEDYEALTGEAPDKRWKLDRLAKEVHDQVATLSAGMDGK